jgi:sec-independent protein translocase protein TatB
MFPEDRFVELLIIGALALIFIGPKDLPILMRRIGRFVGKMRGMAAEFRASFDELARQSELDELRKEVEALRHNSPPAPRAEPSADRAPYQLEAPVMTPIEPPALVEAAPEPTPAPKPKAPRKPRAKTVKPEGDLT